MTTTLQLYEELNTCFGPRARLDEPLTKHTTLRLGGPADIWFPAKSADELVNVVSLAQTFAMPYFILGGGANLLIRDAGIRGVVIENRASAVRFSETQVYLESGVVMPRLAKQCAAKGLSGFEWAIGVPGTIGGAVINNAGAYGQSIANNLNRVELLEPQGERVWRDVSWFNYQYRTSKLKSSTENKPVVLQSILDLEPAAVTEVEGQMKTYNSHRKATQPPGATIGSMFKNPPNDYAGRLIEAAGLKGHRQGQAQISEIHANFFVNLGAAKADDVLALINLAQEKVYQTFHLDLALEIEII